MRCGLWLAQILHVAGTGASFSCPGRLTPLGQRLQGPGQSRARLSEELGKSRPDNSKPGRLFEEGVLDQKGRHCW